MLHTLGGVSHLVCDIAHLVSDVLLQENYNASEYAITALHVLPVLLHTQPLWRELAESFVDNALLNICST